MLFPCKGLGFAVVFVVVILGARNIDDCVFGDVAQMWYSFMM